MPSEAKLKLSVDTSQAQQQIRLIDKQLSELGKGSSAVDNMRKSMGTASEQGSQGIDSTVIERFVHSQERFMDSFTDYMNNTRQNNQSVVNRLEKINESLKTSSKSNSGGGSGGGTVDGLKGVLGKLATGATIASAVKSLISYANQGAVSSAKSELQAYEVFNTTGLYKGKYDTARNEQSDIGSPYGYNVYDTLGVQSQLIGSTGSSTLGNIMLGTEHLLETSRALSVNSGNLTDVFGSTYQTGTFDTGDIDRFVDLFASSILESNMVGREDEQLEILESINGLLDKNLTEITEGQYKSALGLYSMFSSSSSALSGSSSLSLVESLNEAITGGDTSMDIALGKYSGKYSSLWEYEKQKEKGISDTQNLSSILSYVESYAGDLTTDTGKHTLQKFLQSNSSDLSTTEIEAIVNNIDKIKSGEYVDALDYSKGDKFIEDNIQNFNDSKLQDMLQYEAESLNAQERIGDAQNEATSVLKGLYNDMPQWLQNATSGVGAVLEGVFKIGGTWLTGYLGAKSAGKIKGLFGKTTPDGNKVKGADSLDDGAKALDSMDDGAKVLSSTDEGAKALSSMDEGAKVLSSTDEMTKVAGSLNEIADSADDMAKVAGSLDEVAKGASTLSKAGKILSIAGIAIETGVTAYEMSEANKRGDKRDVASELGGGIGGIGGGAGGGAGGAVVGAAIGSIFGPGGTVVGGIIGGIIGGGAGGYAGDKLGEEIGGSIYDSNNAGPSLNSEQLKKLDELYEETKRLYEKNGNNSAQDYTLNTVVPYLNSIGISKSITDDYENDTGKPDFMKDYEAGDVFGNRVGGSSRRSTGGRRARGGSGGHIGSFAIGLDYVPYDGFLAQLHKGETILDAHSADEYRKGKGTSSDEIGGIFEIRVSGSIDGMTNENQNAIVTSVVSQIKNYLGNSNMMNQLAYNNIRVSN